MGKQTTTTTTTQHNTSQQHPKEQQQQHPHPMKLMTTEAFEIVTASTTQRYPNIEPGKDHDAVTTSTTNQSRSAATYSPQPQTSLKMMVQTSNAAEHEPPPPAPRTVHFEEQKKIYDTLSSYDMTDEEYATTWWSGHELLEIKEACRQLRIQYPRLNFVDFRHDVQRNASFRGLEMMDDTTKQERMTRYQHALDMIVYAPKEELEHAKGKHNDDDNGCRPTLFGRSCHNQYYGEQAQAEAYERGQRDARIAHEMATLIDHDDKNPHKHHQRQRSASVSSLLSPSTKAFPNVRNFVKQKSHPKLMFETMGKRAGRIKSASLGFFQSHKK